MPPGTQAVVRQREGQPNFIGRKWATLLEVRGTKSPIADDDGTIPFCEPLSSEC